MFKIPRRTYPELDTLRLISVLLIVVHHFFCRDNKVLAWFSDYGSVGVDFFFVISGFIITRNLLREYELTQDISFKNFWLNRIIRLWPSWLICFVTLLLLSPSYEYWWHYLLHFGNYSLTLTQSFQRYTLFWSLAVEEHFYLIWPVLIYFFLRHPRKKITGLLLLLFLPLAFRIYHSFTSNNPILNRFATHTRFDQLMIGCILAFILDKLPKLNWKSEIFLSVSVVTLLTLAFYKLQLIQGPSIIAQLYYSFTALAAALLIVIALKGKDRGLRALLKIPILADLGILSYGVYLVHTIYIILLLKINISLKLNMGGNLAVIITLIASFLTAYLLYVFVDLPLSHFKRKR